MWLAVRQDIEISPGKLATQAGHAYQWHAVRALQQAPEVMRAYLETDTPKITVKARDEAMLRRVLAEAEAAGLVAVLITDAGRTEFAGPTPTVVAFGPAYRDELPPFLKRLQLL
jgi:PTH2 family peptidyl-tRNA hydrolase